jgi:glycosyltransferase involved in cell wall biosynthesis
MNVCMVAYSFYENDNRIMRYAEALASRGDRVKVLSLQRNDNPKVEVINGVTVCRIQRRKINEWGKLSYLSRMMQFLVRSAWILTNEHRKQPLDLIHVHSVPDFEVFAAFMPKLHGAKVILDIHDIVPEFYSSKFSVRKDSSIFKTLMLVERWSTAFANHVIIANHIWEKVITQRSVSPEKCSTYLNYPDSRLFNKNLRTRKADDRIIMMYPGSLNWHQGVDIAVRAFDLIKDQVPEVEFYIYGDGSGREDLARLIKERSLQQRVKLMHIIPIQEIAGVMANADIGIVPKRNDSFGGEAFSTKIFEFMALGVPVVAANTKIDTYYFNDSLIKFFRAEDDQSLADAMLAMVRNRELRKKLAANALDYIASQSWDIKRQDYFNLVDRLVEEKA